jgi:NAD(P)-dependent dehydrogenase (short-subunit alcohol dehydrogenase family)
MTSVPKLAVTGKVAIITGAGRGIGASIARSLAKAGAAVVVNDLDSEAGQRTAALIVAEGGNAIHVQGDVGDEPSVTNLFEATIQWRGRLDVLVCNAGVTESETIFTISLAHWEQVLRTNLTGAFLCAKYGMQIMKNQGNGGE